MKEIKDYLHLYLECEVLDGQGVIRVLRAVNIHGYATLSYNGIGEEEDIPFEDFKPILRPLSDMTEEEEKCCGEIGFSVNGQYELLRYLLSKHFDLFNLIESGLAIDKKTLTNK